MDGRVLIFRVQRYNTFPTRGQPPFYDKRLKRYRIFNIRRIFDDVIDKNVDVSKNFPNFEKVKTQIYLYLVGLLAYQFSRP